MFDMFTSLMAMTPAGGQQDPGGGLVMTLVMFGGIILIMYFLMIRPQQKRQKEHKAMIESIKKGDKVITTSGMHGTVSDIDGNTFVVQIADNIKVTFEKHAISSKK